MDGDAEPSFYVCVLLSNCTSFYVYVRVNWRDSYVRNTSIISCVTQNTHTRSYMHAWSLRK